MAVWVRQDAVDGTVHMNGRVYDPLLGKFVSADPYVTDSMNGQSYNRYSYVLNNPTNLTDPTGYDWTEYIPVYGSVKDFESSVGDGHFWTAAAFGTLAIVDGATLGIGQLATAPLKAMIKAGIKAEIKAQLAKEGVEEGVRLAAQSAKAAERRAAKESAEKAGEAAAAETKMAATGSERAKSGGVEKTASGKRKEDFTTSDRNKAKAENASQNDGQMKCTDCKRDVESVSSKGGTPENQAQVHHDPAIKDGGTRATSEKVVLCPECHKKRHRAEKVDKSPPPNEG